jgi:hypothetical protein
MDALGNPKWTSIRDAAGSLTHAFGGQVAWLLVSDEHRSERIERCVSEEWRS